MLAMTYGENTPAGRRELMIAEILLEGQEGFCSLLRGLRGYAAILWSQAGLNAAQVQKLQ
jgi:hypothetical protein